MEILVDGPLIPTIVGYHDVYCRNAYCMYTHTSDLHGGIKMFLCPMIEDFKRTFPIWIPTTFFAFPEKCFFSRVCKLSEPIRCAYTQHICKQQQFQNFLGKNLWKTSYHGTRMETPLRCLSWPNANSVYFLIPNLTAMPCQYHITYKLWCMCNS